MKKHLVAAVAHVLLDHWVIAAAYYAIVMAVFAPIVTRGFGWPVLWIHLCAVAYALHQLEEHWGDRFRRFVNDRIFGGAEALSCWAVWWINVPAVWGVNAAALFAAIWWDPSAGLVAPYLMIVNALGHVGAAVRFGYNPGLATSLFLFLPLGVWTLVQIPASWGMHGVALSLSLLIHAVIIVFMVTRARASGT